MHCRLRGCRLRGCQHRRHRCRRHPAAERVDGEGPDGVQLRPRDHDASVGRRGVVTHQGSDSTLWCAQVRARGAQVRGRRLRGVHDVVRVGDTVTVAVPPVSGPGAGQELHRTGGPVEPGVPVPPPTVRVGDDPCSCRRPVQARAQDVPAGAAAWVHPPARRVPGLDLADAGEQGPREAAGGRPASRHPLGALVRHQDRRGDAQRRLTRPRRSADPRQPGRRRRHGSRDGGRSRARAGHHRCRSAGPLPQLGTGGRAVRTGSGVWDLVPDAEHDGRGTGGVRGLGGSGGHGSRARPQARGDAEHEDARSLACSHPSPPSQRPAEGPPGAAATATGSEKPVALRPTPAAGPRGTPVRAAGRSAGRTATARRPRRPAERGTHRPT